MTERRKKTRVGVVGIGHLGGYHLQKYSKIDSCEIIAASDTQLDRAEKVAGFTAARLWRITGR
jgi:predicted dehydrogenase